MKTNDDYHTVCQMLARLSRWLATFLFLFTLTARSAVPLVQNGGFETGSFSSWTQSGNTGFTAVTTDSVSVHSGVYGAYFGPVGSLGYLSQTPLATVTGESYLLSFWLENFGNTNDEFSVAWNGSIIYDQTNLPVFGWSNFVFAVTANSTNTAFQFGFRNDPSSFSLDDVNVTPLCIGLTFDTLPAGAVPNGYGGLNWNNFSVLDGVHYINNPSGYGAGVVSTNNVAWSVGTASITNDTPFNLFSAYLTSAWSDNLQLETKGYANGVLIYDTTNFLNVTGPTLINFNYLGVTEVDFTTSGGTHHAGYVGSGVQFAMDNVNAATGPGVESNPQIAVPLPGPLSGQAAYVRSTSGEPWGRTDNDVAMNSVFGTNGWQDLRYETVSPAALFSPAMHFIFMEGSDFNATALNTFLTANLAALQTWVSNGGSLFINAAPNQGGNINCGFGVTLNYNLTQYSTSGSAAILLNPIFNGPFTPVGTNWTGNDFSDATISGAGVIPLIINTNNGSIILGEINYGSGHALFGGMTIPYWQAPSPQVANLRANILAYGNVNPQATFDDLPPTAESPVPGFYHGLIWNNFDYLNGVSYSVGPNGYDAGVVSSSNVAFNAYGSPASITSALGSHFNFISAELTAAWNDNLQLEAQGYVDGALTYDQTYTLSATTPTLIVFNYLGVTKVNFISSGGTPHSGYAGGGVNFVMDNVSVGAVQPPVIQSITPLSGMVNLTWNAFVNVPYQVQYKTNLAQATWFNLGNIITGPGATAATFDLIGTNSMRFYRVELLP
jgi:hypothetical protein